MITFAIISIVLVSFAVLIISVLDVIRINRTVKADRRTIEIMKLLASLV
jgi:hypothetical protein